MSRPELAFHPEYQAYYDQPAGKEHYRLLERLSETAPEGSLIVDVGTLFGSSALALAINRAVDVVTYDIKNHIPPYATIRDVPNITFKIRDGVKAVPDFAKKTHIICLDIDPHDGLQEKAFFEALEEHGFRGMVVCDDIHLNDAMETWWNSIERRKEDCTARGHWSGTGIVYFD